MRESKRSKFLRISFDNHLGYRHFTCWPGLSGDSVIPWVLITGSIWLPMTVAMIWPWALVNNCGVIGCTWSPWAPPAAWLEGTGLGINGIVPIIWKNDTERENARLPHIIVLCMLNLGKISTERQKWQAEGEKQRLLYRCDEDFQTHLSRHRSPVCFTTAHCHPQQICCGWQCMKQMLDHALAPGWCFIPTSCLNTEWNRCKYQSVSLSTTHSYNVINCELRGLCNFPWFTDT